MVFSTVTTAIILAFLSTNLAQFDQLMAGWKLYSYLRKNGVYYRPMITGRIQFWFEPPIERRDILSPDFELTEDSSIRIHNLKYLHNSIILGWVPILPIILLKLIKAQLLKVLKQDKYFLKDLVVNEQPRNPAD